MISEDFLKRLGDKATMLLRIFITENKASLDNLNAAFRDGDAALVKTWAHKMKGSSISYTAYEISDIAANIEAHPDENDPEERIGPLNTSFEDLVRFLVSRYPELNDEK